MTKTDPARGSRSLKSRAIAALARRDYSRFELARKLSEHEPDEQVVAGLLDELTQKGFLSDERFALATARRLSARYGRARVEQTLSGHNLDRGLIDQALTLATQDSGSELRRAFEVWQKRFGQPPADLPEKAKQFRFLTSRGFSPDVLRRLEAMRYMPPDE
ncbi:MAG: recombination regulator RecX [Burkholderiaceae bacterium]